MVLLATVLVPRDVSNVGGQLRVKCLIYIVCHRLLELGWSTFEVVTIWKSPYHCLESADGVGDMSLQNWTTLPLLRKHECSRVPDSAHKHMSAC